MRIVSIITAIVVIFVLYILVFEREAFNKVANGNSIKSVVNERLGAENIKTQAKVVNEKASKQSEENSELVSVVVYKSNSNSIIALPSLVEAVTFFTPSKPCKDSSCLLTISLSIRSRPAIAISISVFPSLIFFKIS